MASDIKDSEVPSLDAIDGLLSRCNTLQATLSSYISFVKAHGLSGQVHIRPFANLVTSERKFLERRIEVARQNAEKHGARERTDNTKGALTNSDISGLSLKEDDETGSPKALDDAASESSGSTLTNRSPSDQTASDLTQTLRSTNLPYLEAIWAAATERSGGSITALHQRVTWTDFPPAHRDRPSKDNALPVVRDDEDDDNNGLSSHGKIHSTAYANSKVSGSSISGPKKSVFVDIVSRGGQQWIKVSTITERRLIFELAREGWGEESDSESEDDEEPDQNNTLPPGQSSSASLQLDPTLEEPPPTSVERVAATLMRASRHKRVNYQHPSVLFLFTRLNEDKTSPSVASILKRMRKAGVTVHCGSITPAPSPALPIPIPYADTGSLPESVPLVSPQQSLFEYLLPLEHPPLTSTLNLDCTILLALISDVSNDNIAMPEAAASSVAKQIETERRHPLLPNVLYPKLKTRGLVTCEPAAARMREIVAIMGTTTEKQRAEILLGEGEHEANDRATLVSRWQSLANHAVPVDLWLPVRVIPDQEAATLETRLPSTAGKVTERRKLSAINRGVWMLGWATGWISVTSNRAVAKDIEAVVNQILDEEEAKAQVKGGNRTRKREMQKDEAAGIFPGPQVWAVETARSLVGRELKRR